MGVAGPPDAVVAGYGDAGLLVTFLQADATARWAAAQALQAALLERADAGIVDVVAGFDSAFVTFDPLRTDHEAVGALVTSLEDGAVTPPVGRDFVLPVLYGGSAGPDLEVVAAELGLEPAELIARHTSRPWTIRLRASPAGAPMMDGSALPGSVSRNPSPRTRLEPGSVALSGRQCMIYPVASPGGWRVIGRTPMPLFDLDLPELVAYRPRDRFRFRAIDESEWHVWTAATLAPEGP